MNNTKWAGLAIYSAMVVAALLYPGTGLARGIIWVFVALAVIHFIEFLAMQKVLKAAEGRMRMHFFQTMLFGIVHWNPLKKAADED